MNKFKCLILSFHLLFSTISLFSMDLIFPRYLSSSDFEEAITLLQGSTTDDSDGLLNDYDIMKMIKILKEIRASRSFKDIYIKTAFVNNELALQISENFSLNNEKFIELNEYYNAKFTSAPFASQCIIKFKRPIDILRVKEIYSKIEGVDSLKTIAPRALTTKNRNKSAGHMRRTRKINFKIIDGIWIFYQINNTSKLSWDIARYDSEQCILEIFEIRSPLESVDLVPFLKNSPRVC